MIQMSCWSCGTDLLVAEDRRDRRKTIAGENTIDPALRLCCRCWREVKRGNVNRTPALLAVLVAEYGR